MANPGKTTKEAVKASQGRAKHAQAQFSKGASGDTVEDFTSKDILQALENNECGEAELLKQAMRGKFCFDFLQARYFRFSGGYWQADISSACMVFAHDTLFHAYEQERQRQLAKSRNTQAESEAPTPEAQEAAKKARERAKDKAQEIERRLTQINTLRRLNSLLKLATFGDKGITIDGKSWNSDRWILQAQNKVIDLRTGKARQGTPEDFINKAAPTEWRGLDEPCEAWRDFMQDVFGDGDLVFYMQKILGAALIGMPITREFYIFVGEGSNGKSTLFETIKEVLGDDLAGPIKSEVIMDDKRNGGKADPELLELNGKRIVWVSETKKNEKLDTEQIKTFTGGDTMVGRLNYSNDILRFSPSHTLFLLTNNKPRISGGGTAIWDRLRLVEFKTRFVDNPNPNLGEKPRDYELKKRLLSEKSGILAWLVQGCIAYLQTGLNPPMSVLQNSEDYRLDQDTILDFMQEKCLLGTDIDGKEYKTLSGDLYKAYLQWYKDTYGEDSEPIKHKSFTRDLKERTGIRYDRSHRSYFYGIGLLDGGASLLQGAELF